MVDYKQLLLSQGRDQYIQTYIDRYEGEPNFQERFIADWVDILADLFLEWQSFSLSSLGFTSTIHAVVRCSVIHEMIKPLIVVNDFINHLPGSIGYGIQQTMVYWFINQNRHELLSQFLMSDGTENIVWLAKTNKQINDTISIFDNECATLVKSLMTLTG